MTEDNTERSVPLREDLSVTHRTRPGQATGPQGGHGLEPGSGGVGAAHSLWARAAVRPPLLIL